MFAIYESAVGYIKIEASDDIVTFLKKVDNPDHLGEKTYFTDFVFSQIKEYLEGKRKDFTFKYELKGTPFQKRVWNSLLEIPYGEISSYKDIAKKIGDEKASRAVGHANNKNPITIVVPCHRVVGSSGNLVGYAGGLAMKEFLLALEKDNKGVK